MEMFLSDTDCETSSESSYSDYLDDIDSMYGGQAQSILSNLERSIGRIDDFLSFERGFIHGDVVYYATDPTGQLGKVVDVDINADLETVHGELLTEVNCKKLLKICPFVVGDYVVHGPWLGRVRRVVERLTILFKDRAKCEVTAVNPEDISPVGPSIVEDSQYPYYPGQHVKIKLSSVFNKTRWLWGGCKENRAEGTVSHVEAGIVYVDWVASAMIGCETSVPAPPSRQDSENLTLLSCFSHATWQLGDWCILPADDQSVLTEQVNAFSEGHISELEKSEGRLSQGGHNSSFEEIYFIVKKKTKVDVLWQDGTHSIGLDSLSLLPVNNVGDHEFWPEQFVLEKSSCDELVVAAGQRSGVVKSVDAKERTVRLKWQTRAENLANDPKGKSNKETVSVYELVEHPHYSYCLGDIVFRLGKTLTVIQPDKGSESEGHPITETSLDSVQQLGEDCLTGKLASESWNYQSKCYLSCIGNVIGFKEGGILVRWATGHMSKVGPWEIVGINKYEDPVAAPVRREEEIEDKLTQVMPENDKRFSYTKDKDVLDYAGITVGGDDTKSTWETHASFLPQAAIGFFKNIAVSLFGSSGSTSLSSLTGKSPLSILDSNQPASVIANKTEFLYEKEEQTGYNQTSVQVPVADDLQINTELTEPQVKEPYCSSTSEHPGIFKQFDTVGDISDHYFVHGTGKESTLPQVKGSWLKKVQQEWSILERNLPDSIYVRVCEERIDLLRAVIIGSVGTPYHDGLFFFDFYLPPTYPNEPPMVHYHSGGLRLNPNLYESGKICLSLLNTWMGTGTEAWNPGSSTILQVLLSLQALVLNEKPYFNEAGYDTLVGGAEGEKNSITYNENAFLLSCKSMLYIISRPPKHFVELVEEHFKRRSHSILLSCKAYMDGAPVGYAFGGESVAQETQKGSSKGFKIMLAKLFPKLVSSFTGKGIDCSQYLDLENGLSTFQI